MTTPSKPQRKAAAHLGLRLSLDELTLLHGIVRQINDELHKSGVSGTMDSSRLIRRWIREEARRRGLLASDGATRIQEAVEKRAADDTPPKSRKSKAP